MAEFRYRSFEKDYPAPSGWIQWKGTDVCIDIYCTCGKHLHFDGDFMYFGQCPHCGQYFECDGHITLHPIPKEEIEEALKSGQICEPEIFDRDSDDRSTSVSPALRSGAETPPDR